MAVLTERPPLKTPVQEPRREISEGTWTTLAATGITLVLALISIAAGRPMLFPSLAPATVTHVAYPRLRSARPYSTVVGQFLAIGSGYFANWLVGANHVASVFALTSGFPTRRAWSSVLGIVFMMMTQTTTDSVNPPAAATLLLITLGAFAPIARDFWTLVGGVLIMAILGEWVRRMRLTHPEAKSIGLY